MFVSTNNIKEKVDYNNYCYSKHLVLDLGLDA